MTSTRYKTSSVGQSAGLLIPRSSVQFQQKLQKPRIQICMDLNYIHPQKTAGKWWKCDPISEHPTPELATWVGHEFGGLVSHQCRWAGVVWAPRCPDLSDGLLVGVGCSSLTLRFSWTVTLIILGLGFLPACSLTAALLYRCFPSNLFTTTQGVIVKLRGTSSELCTLFMWSV